VLFVLVLGSSVLSTIRGGFHTAYGVTEGESSSLAPQALYQKREFRNAANKLLKMSETRRLMAPELKLLSMCYYQVGLEEFKNDKMEQATGMFQAAIKTYPENAYANYMLGMVSESKGDNLDAAAYYHLALQYDASLKDRIAARFETALGKIFLSEIDADLGGGRYTEAQQKLWYVNAYCKDSFKKDLEEKWQKYQAEMAALQLYRQAEQITRLHKENKAAKFLQELTEKYPDTYLAFNAREGLLAAGEKAYIPETGTGYKLSSEWGRTESDHFIVLYQKGMRIATTVKSAEDAILEVLKDLGLSRYPLDKKIKMYLFQDYKTWQEFLRANPDKTIHWAGGFAIPRFAEIYVYVLDKGTDLRKILLPHELTHIIHMHYIGVRKYQPIWLLEGLARCQEKNGLKEAKRLVGDLSDEGMIPLSRLVSMDVRTYSGSVVPIFYAESALLVDVIREKYGQRKILELIHAFAKVNNPQEWIGIGAEKSFESIISEVLGTDTVTLEKMWLKRAGK